MKMSEIRLCVHKSSIYLQHLHNKMSLAIIRSQCEVSMRNSSPHVCRICGKAEIPLAAQLYAIFSSISSSSKSEVVISAPRDFFRNTANAPVPLPNSMIRRPLNNFWCSINQSAKTDAPGQSKFALTG
eukprot:Gb_09170 [translate_table: standard]